MRILAWSCLVLALLNAGWWPLLSAWAVRRWRKQPPSPELPPSSWPGVTVIVPVTSQAGEEEAGPALASLRGQDYPGEIQILIPPGRAEEEEVPATDKVRQLIRGAQLGRHPWLVFWDADVRAPADLLRRLVAALCRPGAGLAYAFPCWTGARTLAGMILSTWANAQVSSFLLPAAAFARRRPVTGAVMAISRQVLRSLGGAEALRGYLADDARLGELVAREGYEAVPCGWVETGTGRIGWRQAFSTFLRWLLTLRHHTPLAYALSFLCQGAFLALVWGAWARSQGFSPAASWTPLFLVAASRGWLAGFPHRLARGEGGPPPLGAGLQVLGADLASALLWPVALLARRVTWAGRTYHLGTGGRLVGKQSHPRERQ